jgi:hypothetical protein
MKRFTLIIALSVISLLAFSQNKTLLQQKVLKIKATTDQVVKQTNYLSRFYQVAENPGLNTALVLKNGATQKLDSIVSWASINGGQTWVYEWMDRYDYDSQMRGIVWYQKEWDAGAEAWKTFEKIEVEYGSSGKISSLLTYSLDDQTGQLVVDSKMEVYFSPEEKLDSIYAYEPQPGDTWMLFSKNYYYYNNSGLLSQWDVWILDEGVMAKSLIIKYEYNNSNQILTESSFFIIEGEEFLFSKTEHTYNGVSGYLEYSEVSQVNLLTFVLEKDNRSDYEYNTTGDVSVEIFSLWNSQGEAWVADEKYENFYGELNFSDVVFPLYIDFISGIGVPSNIPNKAIIQDKTFDMVDGNWVQVDQAFYYYSAGSSTSIYELENLSVGFYPNPAFEDIILKWGENYQNLNLQVFQMTGAKVMEKQVVSGEKVSVSHLIKGIYLVKLLNGQKTVYTGKMVIN